VDQYGIEMASLVQKRKRKLRFQGKKSVDHFAEGLMIFT
jgi:hypothetical protein